MSGFDAIKKRAKLSLDEMYDSQPVGVLDTQKPTKPVTFQTVKPAATLQPAKPAPAATVAPSYPPMKPQQSPKQSSYKMTFNLSEKAFKTFNDLYAKRMLKGCKTEKSDLICEAIEWLSKMEK